MNTINLNYQPEPEMEIQGDTINVYPMGDGGKHTMSARCKCKPYYADGCDDVLIHSSFDRREWLEFGVVNKSGDILESYFPEDGQFLQHNLIVVVAESCDGKKILEFKNLPSGSITLNAKKLLPKDIKQIPEEAHPFSLNYGRDVVWAFEGEQFIINGEDSILLYSWLKTKAGQNA